MFGIRQHDFASPDIDKAFRFQLNEQDRHRLASAANEIRQLLMCQLDPQSNAVIGTRSELLRQVEQ